MRTKIRISGIDGLAEAMMSAGEEMSAKVDEMLEAGGAALEKAWREAAPVSTGDSKTSGTLKASIKASSIFRKGNNFAYVTVKPMGIHHGSQTNSTVGFFTNYGTKKTKATHWANRANEQGESDAYAEMERVWNG